MPIATYKPGQGSGKLADRLADKATYNPATGKHYTAAEISAAVKAHAAVKGAGNKATYTKQLIADKAGNTLAQRAAKQAAGKRTSK